MEANKCGKEWFPQEGSRARITWTTIDRSISSLRSTKIPCPVTKLSVAKPRSYCPLLYRKLMPYSVEDAKTSISKTDEPHTGEDAEASTSKSGNPFPDEDAEAITVKSMSPCEALSIPLPEESDSDDCAYSEDSELSWTPRGAVIILHKTKIPVPENPGHLVMPRRYRITFPWNDNWAYAR